MDIIFKLRDTENFADLVDFMLHVRRSEVAYFKLKHPGPMPPVTVNWICLHQGNRYRVLDKAIVPDVWPPLAVLTKGQAT